MSSNGQKKGIETSDLGQVQIERGKNWLLLIAIKDYIKKPLNNCVRDAEALREVLQKQYTFEKQEVIKLYDPKATRSNILSTLRQLMENESIENRIGENDNLVIYYSGHGIIDGLTGEFCWVPIEAESGDTSLYVTRYDIISHLNPIKARHVFLIVDSCFSGTMVGYQTKSLDELSERLEAKRSCWGLSSSRDEEAWDGPPGEHSPFAKALIDILTKNDDPLRIGDLGQRIINDVVNVKKTPQTPKIEALEVKWHEAGEMVFHPRDSVKKTLEPKIKFIQPDILAHLPIQDDIGYPKTPFKGLRWFEKEDARVFFGRKKEIRDLFQLLDNKHDARKKLILLYGPSGAGKSSFLSAGLLPHLPKDWKVEYKRRGQEGSALDILNSYEAPEKAHSVLILDQLEEVFSNPGKNGAEEKEKLTAALTSAMERFPNLSVILSFREEYLGRIVNLLNQPADAYTSMVINHLDKEGMVEALSGAASEPVNANYGNLAYEDSDLPLEIAADFFALDSKTYTPLIQYLLRRMWDETSTQGDEDTPLFFTRVLYKRMRRTSLLDLLDTQMEEAGGTFPEELGNGLLIDLLFFFVTKDFTSGLHTLSEIKSQYNHIQREGKISDICRTLENCHLLSSFSNTQGELCYRLCHDALAQFVMQRYNESERAGQQASRYLEHAIRTYTPLPKEAVLIVDRGQYGRRVPSEKEKQLIRNGWNDHIKALVRDRLGQNEIEEGCKLLQMYSDRFNLGYEGILLLSQINDLNKQSARGTISFEEYRTRKDKIRNELLTFTNNLGFEQRKTCLMIILDCMLSGEDRKLIRAINTFIEHEEPSTIASLQDISGRLVDITQNLQKGFISNEMFIFHYSKILNPLISIILDDYFFKPQNTAPLLDDISLKSAISKIIGELKENHSEILDEIVFEEVNKMIYKKDFRENINDLDRVVKLLLVHGLLNWVRQGVISGVLSSQTATYLSNRLLFALNLLFRPPRYIETAPMGLDEPNTPFYLLKLLYKNKLEDALSLIKNREIIEFELDADKTRQDQIGMGFFLLSFDDYRIYRNRHISNLFNALDDKYGLLDNFLKHQAKNNKYEEYCRSVLEKVHGGMLTEAFGPLEGILEKKIPLRIDGLIIAGSLESEIYKMARESRINEEDFTYWQNRIRNMLVQCCNELWHEDTADGPDEINYDEIPENISVEDVRKKISTGEIKLALAYVAKILSSRNIENDLYVTCQILRNRFAKLEQDAKEGTIKTENYMIEFNRIMSAIIELATLIENS